MVGYGLFLTIRNRIRRSMQPVYQKTSLPPGFDSSASELRLDTLPLGELVWLSGHVESVESQFAAPLSKRACAGYVVHVVDDGSHVPVEARIANFVLRTASRERVRIVETSSVHFAGLSERSAFSLLRKAHARVYLDSMNATGFDANADAHEEILIEGAYVRIQGVLARDFEDRNTEQYRGRALGWCLRAPDAEDLQIVQV